MKKLSINNLTLTMMSVAFAVIPAQVWADSASFLDKDGGACKFVSNIHTVLNLMSVTVVTIAIIFAGYQIAFAHKRISDVAPVLIGGVLIGAAGQIAKMLVNGSDACSGSNAALHIMQFFA